MYQDTVRKRRPIELHIGPGNSGYYQVIEQWNAMLGDSDVTAWGMPLILRLLDLVDGLDNTDDTMRVYAAPEWAEIVARCGPAEALMQLSTEQKFTIFWAWGTIYRGWALAEQGEHEEGVTHIREGMATCRAGGTELRWPYWLALLVEAYGPNGKNEDVLPLLTEALDVMDQRAERFWAAEVHRLKGEILLRQALPDMPQAETCFRHALDVARSQQAKSLELRAATSLARLWQSQGKHKDAYDLLAPVYGWFTEGFDTADLKDAKALLDELSEGQ